MVNANPTASGVASPYEAPGWVFALVYTAFGALTVAAWFLVRPGR